MELLTQKKTIVKYLKKYKGIYVHDKKASFFFTKETMVLFTILSFFLLLILSLSLSLSLCFFIIYIYKYFFAL